MVTILLVEDHEELGGILEESLLRAGYNVVRAHNGVEALQVYDPQKVNLVVTDLIMPDMEGIELIIQLKRIHPGVKIIAMSGGGKSSPDTYLQIARSFGVTHTLAKPFSCEELKVLVKKAINLDDDASKTD